MTYAFDGPLVLDACTLLTLYAADMISCVTGMFAGGILVPKQVVEEAQYMIILKSTDHVL